MKNSIQDGDRIPLAAPYAVSAGGGALVGATFGVAVNTLANAEVGTFSLEGVFVLAKIAGASNGGAQGSRAYWNNTSRAVTAVSTSNTLIGVFTATCADADTTASVRLNGSF